MQFSKLSEAQLSHSSINNLNKIYYRFKLFTIISEHLAWDDVELQIRASKHFVSSEANFVLRRRLERKDVLSFASYYTIG